MHSHAAMLECCRRIESLSCFVHVPKHVSSLSHVFQRNVNMSTKESKAIVLAAVQSGDFLLASTICMDLAKEAKYDAELWEMAGQLCNQANKPKQAAQCYGYSARVFIAQKKPAQAISMMKHYADLRHEEPQQACRHLFFACRAGGVDCNICTIREAPQDTCCKLFREGEFWQRIPNQGLAILLKESTVRRYTEGTCIAKEGAQATSFYLVSHGSIQLQCRAVHDHALSTIEIGCICGDIPYYAQLPQRVYSMIAGKDCEVVEVPYSTLKKLCQQHPEIKQWMKHRFESNLLEYILVNTPFFSDLSTLSLQDIAQQMQVANFTAGEVIFQQDATHDLDIFIIRSGWVNLNYEWHGRTYHLCTLKSGDMFGTASMLEKKRKVTARSIANSTLMRWPEANFILAYTQCSHLRDNIAKSMIRYQYALDKIRQHNSQSNEPQPEIDRVTLLGEMYCHSDITNAILLH